MTRDGTRVTGADLAVTVALAKRALLASLEVIAVDRRHTGHAEEDS